MSAPDHWSDEGGQFIMGRSMLPVLLESVPYTPFPDPRLADPDGLVAVGGALSRDRLLEAYDNGIFPWYDESNPPLWWSPDPRAVLLPTNLHVSRRLARTLRQGRFRVTWNLSFERVINCCGANRDDGTWVIPEMVEAYCELHQRGDAHSLEVWRDGELIGGIYGVQRGGMFAAESMFHRRRDASKVALVLLVRVLARAGVELVDVQMMTEHLRRMGAVSLSRVAYLERLRGLRDKPVITSSFARHLEEVVAEL